MFSNHPQQPKQPLPQYSGREYIMLQLRNIGRREPMGLPPMVFCLLENGWHSNGFHDSGRKLCRCLFEYIYSVRLFSCHTRPSSILLRRPPFRRRRYSRPFQKQRGHNNAAGRGRGDSPSTARPLSHGGNLAGRDRPIMNFSKLLRSREGGISRYIDSGGTKNEDKSYG